MARDAVPVDFTASTLDSHDGQRRGDQELTVPGVPAGPAEPIRQAREPIGGDWEPHVPGRLPEWIPRPRVPADRLPPGHWSRRVAAPASRRLGLVAGVLVIVLGAIYLVWRAGTLGGTGMIGRVFYGAELLSYVALAWTAVMLGRYRPGDARRPGPPTGTLDVFVTVCGEPASMVEQTLRCALAIDYPHRTYVLNDGRISGRKNWREIDALAARLGVPCFTRVDGTSGKAGNLNHALARTDGDAILTLDADHLVVPDVAEQLVGYLHDPKVGFVCTAQCFDTGRLDMLNNAESIFYRAFQPAKDRDGSAFSTGNGALYRRSALESTGGFSEWNIGEDIHTSYQIHARGWSSVYHARAVSIGTAPATVAVYARQRFRWMMNYMRLMLFDSPLIKSGLSGWQRAHYLHSTLSPLLASSQAVFIVGPPLAIIFRTPFSSETPEAHLLFVGPYLASSLLFMVACGGAGSAIRTAAMTLFNAPLYLTAFFRVVLWHRPRASATEKAFQPRMSVLLLPQIVFA
uniref:glycosyltransferase family 2 protein n=1 Tax=Frankia sp. Cppng1_Ct_nod TaxID=2897162 RepID=UPI001040E4F7